MYIIYMYIRVLSSVYIHIMIIPFSVVLVHGFVCVCVVLNIVAHMHVIGVCGGRVNGSEQLCR